jgi:hypothetical protein
VGERPPTRAVVITAALAQTIVIGLDGAPQAARLQHELHLGPTFESMTDEDLAVLMQRLELELHNRGWSPTRQWAKREEE